MKVSKRAIVNTSLGIVVVAAIAGVYFVINPPTASSTSGATQLTSTVQQGTVSNTITATGSVAPAQEVTASFATPGTIATVAVTLGQTVAAGEVLGTLDPSALQRTANEAQTSYNNSLANLSYATSNLAAATAQASSPSGNGTQLANSAKSAILSARAQVNSAADALATARSNLTAATLTAPISGLVIAVNGTVGGSSGGSSSSSGSSGSGGTSGGASGNSGSSSSGSSSSGSSSGFATIANVSAMTVTANIAEADIASVTVGQTAKVTFPAMTGVNVDARVTAIAPTATSSNSIVTYATTITLDAIPTGLRLGQTASVAITTKSSAANALYVPSAAITTANGVSTVKVVDANDPSKSSSVTVTLGVVGTTGTEIKSGLKAGETVVLGTVSASTGTTGTTGTGGTGGFGGGFRSGFGGGNGGNFRGGNG